MNPGTGGKMEGKDWRMPGAHRSALLECAVANNRETLCQISTQNCTLTSTSAQWHVPKITYITPIMHTHR